MKEAIENAMKLLANRITEGSTPDEALKYTQSALNLAHVLATLDAINRCK